MPTQEHTGDLHWAAERTARNSDVVREFFRRLNTHDVDAALSLVDARAAVDFAPAQIAGVGPEQGRAFLEALVTAFPDLRIQILHMFTGKDGTTLVELKTEGTQAEDFLGVFNQEKYLDLKQAWLLQATEGKITGIRAYWCQNQLYRRLAVKRLDHVSITRK